MMEDTFPKLLVRNYEKWGHKRVALYKKKLGIWKKYTWADSYQKAKLAHSGLVSVGLERGDKVCIIGDNDPEWYWCVLGIQAAGGIPVALWSSTMPSEIEYIINNTDCKFVMVADQEQVDKVAQIWSKTPKVKRVIYWDSKITYDHSSFMSFRELLDLGSQYEESKAGSFEENIAKGKGEDIAAIFHTSGTGGLPKAAMFTHEALISGGRRAQSVYPVREADNYVPLLHMDFVGEFIQGFAVHLLQGMIVNFAERRETLLEDLREVGPTLVIALAPQWESYVSMIQARINDAGFLNRLLYHVFLSVGRKVAGLHFQGRKLGLFLKILYVLGDLIIYRKIKNYLGLSKARYVLTTGSFLGQDAYEFCHTLGIKLRHVYLATEAGGYITAQIGDDIRRDSVGQAAPGVKLMISDTGEIMTFSDSLFLGYYKDPAATAKAVDNRWLRTEDAGFINEEDQLIIYDRASDIGELTDGNKYWPARIEASIRLSPFIKYIMIIGGKERDYSCAVINIDPDNIRRWAEERRIRYSDLIDLGQKPEVAGLIRDEVYRVAKGVFELANLRKYAVLHKEFDPDEAELTRTWKLRRAFVEQRYEELIDAIYKDRAEFPVEATVQYRDGTSGRVKTTIKIWSVK